MERAEVRSAKERQPMILGQRLISVARCVVAGWATLFSQDLSSRHSRAGGSDEIMSLCALLIPKVQKLKIK